MDYKAHYDKLISRAKDRPNVNGYTERHHIIPKWMGGSNMSSNMAVLTPEEHFLAHLLLVKIYPKDHNAVLAARMMVYGNDGKRNNNKLFGWLRRRFSTAAKEHYKANPDRAGRVREKMRLWWAGDNITDEMRVKWSENNTGDRNPKAKTYLLTSPSGMVYTVSGGLKNFCDKHEISLSLMRKFTNRGVVFLDNRHPKTTNRMTNSVGWSINTG